MTKTATVKLTAAIGVAGELVKRDSIITIPEAAAKDLLRRGKAVMATADDEPEAEAVEVEAEAETPADDEPEAAPEAPKPGKKK